MESLKSFWVIPGKQLILTLLANSVEIILFSHRWILLVKLGCPKHIERHLLNRISGEVDHISAWCDSTPCNDFIFPLRHDMDH